MAANHKAAAHAKRLRRQIPHTVGNSVAKIRQNGPRLRVSAWKREGCPTCVFCDTLSTLPQHTPPFVLSLPSDVRAASGGNQGTSGNTFKRGLEIYIAHILMCVYV
jgi:hypothetical protein